MCSVEVTEIFVLLRSKQKPLFPKMLKRSVKKALPWAGCCEQAESMVSLTTQSTCLLRSQHQTLVFSKQHPGTRSLELFIISPPSENKMDFF